MGEARGCTVIYGGSFDPPHMGHQMACLQLLEGMGATEIWLIPTFSHPLGKTLSDYAHRRRMLELMAAPFGERVAISDLEKERGGPSRTYDTVADLQSMFPDRAFCLAIGADILDETKKWYRWPELQQRIPIVVLNRQGYPSQHSGILLPEVASSSVRDLVAGGKSVAGFVPLSVAAYINEQGLYT